MGGAAVPEDAFATLLEEQRRWLLFRGGKWGLDASSSDDMAQATIIRAWIARARFKMGSNLRAWLATIHHRIMQTTHAQKARRRTTTMDGEVIDVTQTTAARDNEERHHDAVLDRLDDRIRNAILRVDPIYREPFLLEHVHGLSMAEIGVKLGIPAGTAMSRTHRAKNKILFQLGRFDMTTMTPAPRAEGEVARGGKGNQGRNFGTREKVLAFLATRGDEATQSVDIVSVVLRQLPQVTPAAVTQAITAALGRGELARLSRGMYALPDVARRLEAPRGTPTPFPQQDPPAAASATAPAEKPWKDTPIALTLPLKHVRLLEELAAQGFLGSSAEEVGEFLLISALIDRHERRGA